MDDLEELLKPQTKSTRKSGPATVYKGDKKTAVDGAKARDALSEKYSKWDALEAIAQFASKSTR